MLYPKEFQFGRKVRDLSAPEAVADGLQGSRQDRAGPKWLPLWSGRTFWCWQRLYASKLGTVMFIHQIITEMQQEQGVWRGPNIQVLQPFLFATVLGVSMLKEIKRTVTFKPREKPFKYVICQYKLASCILGKRKVQYCWNMPQKCQSSKCENCLQILCPELSHC